MSINFEFIGFRINEIQKEQIMFNLSNNVNLSNKVNLRFGVPPVGYHMNIMVIDRSGYFDDIVNLVFGVMRNILGKIKVVGGEILFGEYNYQIELF